MKEPDRVKQIKDAVEEGMQAAFLLAWQKAQDHGRDPTSDPDIQRLGYGQLPLFDQRRYYQEREH